MVKTLATMTALSGLMLSTALAQSPAPSPAPTAAAPTDAKVAVITAQKPDQWLASKLRGADIVGPEKEKVGNVSDILLERNGTVVAYIVGVGGFLGIGAKDVALAPSSFEVIRGENGAPDQLKISLTKDQLKQMAAFEPYSPPARATSDRMSPRPSGTTGTSPRPAQ